MTDRTLEEELEHWRNELRRVLNARADLPWTNLIEWAEEAEHFAAKACTKPGRARLLRLDEQVKELQAEIARLNRDLTASHQAKLSEAEPRLAAMEKLAAAWQKEAERVRKDLAVPADVADVAEMRLWDALERPLTMGEVTEHIKILRGVRHLAVHSIEILTEAWNAPKKRLAALHSPVQHMGRTWCSECSVRRVTGPNTPDEWVAYIPHPCNTLNALDDKEPTT